MLAIIVLNSYKIQSVKFTISLILKFLINRSPLKKVVLVVPVVFNPHSRREQKSPCRPHLKSRRDLKKVVQVVPVVFNLNSRREQKSPCRPHPKSRRDLKKLSKLSLLSSIPTPAGCKKSPCRPHLLKSQRTPSHIPNPYRPPTRGLSSRDRESSSSPAPHPS